VGCLHPGIQYKWNVNWTLIEIQYQSRMLGARRSYQYMKLDMSCCFVWFLSQYIGMYPTPAKYPLSFRSQLRFHAKLRCQELPTSLDVKPTCCENKSPAGNQTRDYFQFESSFLVDLPLLCLITGRQVCLSQAPDGRDVAWFEIDRLRYRATTG